MKNILFVCGFILVFFTSGCQDVIEIEVPESQPLLVIDGLVTDVEGSWIELSTSAPYFDEGITPRINQASIYLYENDILVAEFAQVDSTRGRYFSSYKGSVGNSYFVEIDIPEDEPNFRQSTWRTTPTEMKRVLNVDSANYRLLNRRTNPQAFEEGVYALAYFREPKGEGDTYRVKRWLNDSAFSSDLFLIEDLGFDGLYFGQPPIGGFAVYGPLATGDSLSFEISSLSRDHYDYLSLLLQQVFQVGSTFDPPPAPLYGNVYNKDDKDQLGFGYFGASALEEATVYYP